MRAELRRLTERSSARKAKYGDVIGVHRIGGLYDHYGVFESEERVYEYAAVAGDMGNPEVRVSTLREFLRDDDTYFVLVFPKARGRPGKISVPVLKCGNQHTFRATALPLRRARTTEIQDAAKSYHLYSPEETIKRARSRLGEQEYDLALNNCEHFALWCKTGVSQSHQVDALQEIVETAQCIVKYAELQ